MRKFIIALVAAVALLSFTGCEKEGESLSGTVWENVVGNVTTTISFTGVVCEVSFTAGSESMSSYYSYVYTHPTVIMYPEEDTKATMKGIISDNVMSVVNMSNEKTIGLFTKK